MDAVALICEMLRYLDVSHTRQFVKKVYSSNPEQGNFLGLAQVFSQFGVRANVVKIEKMSDINRFSFPCIAIYKKNFVGITDISISTVNLISENGRIIEVSRSTFDSQSDVYFLFLEKPGSQGEPFYSQHIEKQKVNACVTLTAIVTLILTTIFQLPEIIKYDLCFELIASSVCLIILFFLLKSSLSKNKITYKLCSVSKLFDCNMDIEIINTIHIVDLGVAYYVSIILNIILVPAGVSGVLSFSLAAFVFTIGIIFFQFFIKKKICPLCILVQLITLAIFIRQFIENRIYILAHYDVAEVSVLSLLFILIILLTSHVIRPYFRSKMENISMEYTLNKSKLDFIKTCFIEAERNKSQATSSPLSSLNIHNTKASHEVIVVINPFCKKCGEHYKSSYFKQNTSMACNIKYIFLLGNQSQREIVRRIYCAIENGEDFRTVLFEWYSISKRSELEEFLSRYDNNSVSEKSTNEIFANNEWCISNAIHEVPTVLLDGKKMPYYIDLSDILNVTL